MLIYLPCVAEVTVDPFGFAVSVEANDTLQTEMTLTNHDDRNITFAICMEDVDQMMDLRMSSLRNVHDLPGPARDRRGDPDDAGYFWVDNNEDDGPEFEWIDIVGRDGAERLQVGDNWNSGEIELGFDFPWYGEWYPSLRIGSDGWFTFDPEQEGVFNNLPEFPNEDEPNNILAVDCIDIAPNNQSSLWFWTDGEGVAVISWIMMAPRFSPVRPDITMQAVLIAETGTVFYQYGNQMGLPANLVNVGYENQDGSLGASIFFHQAVAQGLAIAISGPFSKWLIIEPLEGVIPAEDSEVLEVTFLPDDLEAGTYEMLISIELDDPNQPLIEISAVMTVDDPVAAITGIVSDEATNQPVEGAAVTLTRYNYARQSNDEGAYSLSDLPLGEYELTFTAPDYLPATREVNLEDEDIELDVALLHSECNPSIEEITEELAPDEETDINFNITNDGNGTLTYTTDRRLLGDANAEPWELRDDYPAGVIAEDSRIQGAVFIDDMFYLAGANNREPLIYVMNREQEVVNQYAQLGESRYGYKDLAFDGELIWGSGERDIYGFTPEGEEVTSFDTGISPCNNVAWDPDREILWVSGTTSEIIGYDRDGNAVAELNRHELRIYGLAYWADDPDGYQLYIFHKINEVGDMMIAKIDIENQQAMDVVTLEHEAGGVAQGCFITNQYDIYSWVFLGIANNGAEDRIDIWQVDARKDWMAIDPTEGMIEGGEQEDFVVTLDATGLPQALFEGEIVFFHDGVGGETQIPITLRVGEGGEPEEMVLELDDGWNMVSAYVQPDPDDIIEIMADLVEAGTLVMMKNGSGQFYNPQFNFNNIPGWRIDEGYLIKMDDADELILIGDAVPPDQPIELEAGWQMISYYPRQDVDAVVALSGIVDVLLIAKDGEGRFYSPPFLFCNMGDMSAGNGYLVKIEEDVQLIYRTEEEQLAASPVRLSQLKPVHLPIVTSTGINMSLLLRSAEALDGEVGAYSGDLLVGSGVMTDGICGLAVWGDDETTDAKDGSLEGEGFVLRYIDSSTGRESELEVRNITAGKGLVYATNSLLVGDVSMRPEIPHEFYLNQPYPNPFNSTTTLTYGIPEAADVSINIYDISGRFVGSLVNGRVKPGHHKVTWSPHEAPTGIYVVRCVAGGKRGSLKVALIR